MVGVTPSATPAPYGHSSGIEHSSQPADARHMLTTVSSKSWRLLGPRADLRRVRRTESGGGVRGEGDTYRSPSDKDALTLPIVGLAGAGRCDEADAGHPNDTHGPQGRRRRSGRRRWYPADRKEGCQDRGVIVRVALHRSSPGAIAKERPKCDGDPGLMRLCRWSVCRPATWGRRPCGVSRWPNRGFVRRPSRVGVAAAGYAVADGGPVSACDL